MTPLKNSEIPKKSSLKLLVRFGNNLIEMFFEWPFSELFLKFWSVNKHGISEWRLLALYRHKEILVNSSLKTTRKKWFEQSQKIRWVIQGHLGPLVSQCFLSYISLVLQNAVLCGNGLNLYQTVLSLNHSQWELINNKPWKCSWELSDQHFIPFLQGFLSNLVPCNPDF